MTFSSLPPELLYNIVAELVSRYIDEAITSAPKYGVGSSAMREEGDSATGVEADGSDDGYGADSDSDRGGSDHISSVMKGIIHRKREQRRQRIYMDPEFSDDSDESDVDSDGSDIYDNNDLCRFLSIWNVGESEEPLPDNYLLPLLGTSHVLRNVTLKVLRDALGVQGTSDRSPWSTLRFLRRHYRIAHTSPFMSIQQSDYDGVVTPMICAYQCLASAGYFLRRYPEIMEIREIMVKAFTSIASFRTLAEDIPQSYLRPRIAVRLELFYQHASAYNTLYYHRARITRLLVALYELEDLRCHASKATDLFMELDAEIAELQKYDQKVFHTGSSIELSSLVYKRSAFKKLLSMLAHLQNDPKFRGWKPVDSIMQRSRALYEKWNRLAKAPGLPYLSVDSNFPS